MPTSVTSTMSALTLFPGLEDIGPWYRAEVHGLTEAQLDFAVPAPAPEWLWWSIRRQTSHTARVFFLWLFSLWGDTLWDGAPPPVHDLPDILQRPPEGQPAASPLHSHTYGAIDVLLARLDEGIVLTQAVLRRHTVAQAQQKTTTLTLAPRAQRIMAQLQPAHPQGFAPSSTDATQWVVSLEGTGRHLYFEALTHLYNIQRLKRAQGLSACINLPRVGYYVLPGWDNDLQEGTEARETGLLDGSA
jgi:hypothetical protein